MSIKKRGRSLLCNMLVIKSKVNNMGWNGGRFFVNSIAGVG
jgi:hypothetical protein